MTYLAVWLLPLGALQLLSPLLLPILPPSLRGDRFFTGLMAAFVGGAVVGWLVERARRRALGLDCPRCGKALASLRGLTLAGDRCPRCGLRVVDDAAPVSPPRPELPATEQEFTARARQVARDSRRDYAIFIPLSLAIFGGSLLWSLRAFRSNPSPGVFAVFLVGSLTGIGVALWGSRRWETRARRLGLTCPNCGELLIGGAGNATTKAVRFSGACPRCGTALWADVIIPGP